MKRVNKYHAKKTPCHHGHTHASRKEAGRCNELHLLERAGAITHLEIEPQYWFAIEGVQMVHDNGRRVGFRPDFRYRDAVTGRLTVEDCKGMIARDFPLRKAIFRALYPDIELLVT